MRTILSTAIIILISLSCTNSTKTEPIVQTRNSSLYDTLKHENIVFSTPMILAIDTFRQYIQSLDNILPIEKKVLCCYFYSKEGKEYVAMQADLFYPKENIKGYTYMENMPLYIMAKKILETNILTKANYYLITIVCPDFIVMMISPQPFMILMG